MYTSDEDFKYIKSLLWDANDGDTVSTGIRTALTMEQAKEIIPWIYTGKGVYKYCASIKELTGGK